jgi:hypothetical protein
MTAYEIPSTLPNDPEASLPPLLTPFWQLRPAAVTFGRFVKMFHEGAIVSLYEGQIRFIRPDLDASEPNAHVIEKYNVSFAQHPRIRGVTHLHCSSSPHVHKALSGRACSQRSAYSGFLPCTTRKRQHVLGQWLSRRPQSQKTTTVKVVQL